MVYKPMPGCRFTSTQVETIGSELERIHARKGRVKAPDVVEAAKPERSKLHGFFTWDDTEAAKLHRENEARSIIRSVRLVEPEMPLAEQPVMRAFVNVVAKDTETRFTGNAYLPAVKVLNDEQYHQQLLDSAKRALELWRQRYADLHDVAPKFFGMVEEFVS